MQHLQPNTTLQGGKYRIERVLGQGGFGITYLAEQVSLARKVAIKEFFMKDLCGRGYDTRSVEIPSTGSRKLVEQYRNKFIKEARNLARLNHPNIISVIDVFEENGSVYYVMPYLPGGSLQDYVRVHGALSEDGAMMYIRQIASALKYMHEEEHMCHYDVKPANILLDDKGNAVLIDFGISKNYDAAGNETTTTPVGLSEGYAPIEQYQQNVAEFSPVSDVYALGATLYFLLHGKRPVSAVQRVSGSALFMRKSLSQDVKDIINASLKVSKVERAQNMDVFLNYQDDSVVVEDEETLGGDDETKIDTPDIQTLNQGTGTQLFSKFALNSIPQSLFKRRTIHILMALIACLSLLAIFVDIAYNPLNSESLELLRLGILVEGLPVVMLAVIYLPLLSGMKKIDKTVFTLLLIIWVSWLFFLFVCFIGIIGCLPSFWVIVGERYFDYYEQIPFVLEKISLIFNIISIITGMVIIYKYDGRIQKLAKILYITGFLGLLLLQIDDYPQSIDNLMMLAECYGVWRVLISKKQNQINYYSSHDENFDLMMYPWELKEANGETKRWLWLVFPLFVAIIVFGAGVAVHIKVNTPKSGKSAILFTVFVFQGLAWLINKLVKWKLIIYEKRHKQ